MAFSEFVTGSQTGLRTRIYNVDFAVGRTGSNLREDVMLVQALFKIFYFEFLGFNGGFDPPPGETEVIKVDGFIGPITQRHIDHFQSQMIASGRDIVRDGRLDPFRKPRQLTTIQHKAYGMFILNASCQNTTLANASDAFSNLPNRTDMPQTLRNALKTVKTTARQYQ